MLGSFTAPEWKSVYRQCYDNLEPGGWFEQFEGGCNVISDDGSLPKDSCLASKGPNIVGAAARPGRSVDTLDTMRGEIKKAGFIELREKFGLPEPWSLEQVQVFVAKARAEIRNPKYRIYHVSRRIWARKPTVKEAVSIFAEKEKAKKKEKDAGKSNTSQLTTPGLR
ncbi:hypothetical protein N7455_006084 [Penicillium solitum]|uniref:uncharacterized protein n=1 Tax=Penicillium solitum TaxID=60172 RepID=UPI0032C477CA|nr:hypothetical protein N7455_006084 [Penicillium solitum]